MSLKRRIANKLAGVFTPSLLIVLITFTTYWLGPGSISDRVTIGITAFLAIIQSFASARSLLPPISYVSVSERDIHFKYTFYLFLLFYPLSVSLSLSLFVLRTWMVSGDWRGRERIGKESNSLFLHVYSSEICSYDEEDDEMRGWREMEVGNIFCVCGHRASNHSSL